MKLTRQERKTIGKPLKQDCPECNEKKLMQNDQGLIWCSGVYCRFGFEKLKEFFWNKHKKNEDQI